ncbi:DUF3306 domain-containing protein [Massilia sp. ST3]|uniref:DUF3306 domain-containing protein n=1 Tax=Massilia sp. ST3 TaxID=2824903 RepID=UPI001B835CA2|nr:DUF3306 domain-containing protein [Massilia sp. ST3]MBQ5950498.1 DUF3306 domain-containing protein [Massilia sp. ST3]
MSGKTMAEEGFLRRWSRLKSSGGDASPQEAPPPAPPALARTSGGVADEDVQALRPLPTMEDIAGLSFDSDYSGFVAQGVDKAVQRLALKKLFADPHFKVMDGLDIYMDDFNVASPLAADMLAELRHADSALQRVLDDAAPEEGAGAAAAAAPEAQDAVTQQEEDRPQGNPQENPQGNA